MASQTTFAAPRGMRDFYPEDMRLRNRIFDAWRTAAVKSGFEPYDACVVESLELLQRKGGEEISRQIYNFEDKGGRQLALRAEMTPTLARMIVARQNELAFPVKWFAVAQCFRYERMTLGRKREHYQLNLDIIGEDSIAAEAEILYTAVSALRGMGVPDEAYRIHVSNRALLSEVLNALGVPEASHAAVFLALDKRGKISDDEIRALLRDEEGIPEADCDKAFEMLAIESLDDARKIAGPNSPAIGQLDELFSLLRLYGIENQAVFDISVIRGLSYYTGIVFEAFDTQGKFRAIFGGGRYDKLLSAIGGKPMTAVGMGFGDVVVGELLTDLLGDSIKTARSGIIIGYMTPDEREACTRLAARLRSEGNAVALQLHPQKPKQFFSCASAAPFAEAIYIGPDDRANGVARMKNLDTREERQIQL